MIISSNRKAFSLTELMITSVLLIILLTTALAGLVLLKRIFAANIAKATFQRDAAVIMNKIIEGKGDPSGIRLSEAASIPTITDSGKLTFVGTNSAINRMYSLSAGGTSVLYSDSNGIQKTIYTAPKGAIVGLMFSQVNPGAVVLCINVYVSVSQVINGKTVLGALESSVYLRNRAVHS